MARLFCHCASLVWEEKVQQTIFSVEQINLYCLGAIAMTRPDGLRPEIPVLN